ncbi:hypothetical protein O6H91_07G067000 [Diphasiastrum complanatum]|uniref:Uncharacterized protein n=1 Tax=Diphasiastrum complanatum TaxID=34168 RepID=A0ACC2D6B6_DIPCM|nr:hypothetical protein O6H91_07G067000 [Diphasiastrum complanatum]
MQVWMPLKFCSRIACWRLYRHAQLQIPTSHQTKIHRCRLLSGDRCYCWRSLLLKIAIKSLCASPLSRLPESQEYSKVFLLRLSGVVFQSVMQFQSTYSVIFEDLHSQKLMHQRLVSSQSAKLCRRERRFAGEN